MVKYCSINDFYEVHNNLNITPPDTKLSRIQRSFFLDPKFFFFFNLWGSVDVNSPIFAQIAMKILDLYKFDCILTKIFSLDDKTDEGSIIETNVSSSLAKLQAFLG